MSMANTNALKARLEAHRKGGHGVSSSNRKVKTATELEEEAARIKAIEDELEELARKERERWKRIKRFFTLPNPITIAKRLLRDKLKIALKKLDDKKSTIELLFTDMHIKSKKEKWMWVKFWGDIDTNNHNKVRYDRFCAYFRLTQDTWTQRIFDIANISKTGALSFIDWLSFCRDYLYVDRKKTEEFSFRIISRRGVMFRPKISVLDLEDMRLFLKYRFKLKLDEKKLYKTALAVFDYVDSDGDGGLDVGEFEDFTTKNPVFVRF